MPATVLARAGRLVGVVLVVPGQGRASCARCMPRRIRPTGSSICRGIRCSAICGSRRPIPAAGPVQPRAAAGAGDGGRVLAVHHRGDAAVPHDRDLLAGMWELLEQLGRGPAAAGLGQRGRRSAGAAGLAAGVRRRSPGRWRPVGPGQAVRPGVQGHRGAAQRVLRDLVPARPDVHLPADFNAQFGRLAADGERAAGAPDSRPARSICSSADRAAMLPLPPVAPTVGFTDVGRGCGGTTTCACWQRLLRRPGCDRADRRRQRRPGRP